MEIRSPDRTHLPGISALLHQCFPGAWGDERLVEAVFADPRFDPNHVWMAREGGRILGYCATALDGARAWIKILAVDPAQRRRGIAAGLLDRAEFRLRGEGAREARVGTDPPHEFVPGPEPGSGEAAFFMRAGYAVEAEEPVRYLPPLEGRPAPEPMDEAAREQAHAWARARCGSLLPWVEDALACRPAKAVFDPGAGLCLAEPGRSLGPLWALEGVEAPRLKELSARAWALAGSRTPEDAWGLRLWDLPGTGPLPGGLARTRIRARLVKALA